MIHQYRRWLLVLLTLASTFQLPAAAAKDPVIVRGEQIARNQCSACHVVAKDQESPPLLDEPVASFYDIAKRPGLTEQDLMKTIAGKHWNLLDSPPTMPSQELSRDEERAVARYILSLKSH